MKRLRAISFVALLGVATGVCLAALGALCDAPVGPFHAQRVVRNLGGPKEPAIGAMFFERRQSVFLTEVECVVATFVQSEPTDTPVTAEELPAWCGAASSLWTLGDRPWPASNGGDWHVWIGAGWPMRCLGYDFGPATSFPRTAWNSSPIEVHGGMAVRRRSSPNVVAIPFRVIWLGFVADTMVYAAAWFVLFQCVHVAKAMARSRRGHCRSCGYDRQGLPSGAPCPECGNVSTTLKPR